MPKEFHRYTITVTVLTERKIPSLVDMYWIWDECINGDYSGKWDITKDEILKPSDMAAALLDQGSDPAFFGLNASGEEVEE